jgi:hypothetical protein
VAVAKTALIVVFRPLSGRQRTRILRVRRPAQELQLALNPCRYCYSALTPRRGFYL